MKKILTLVAIVATLQLNGCTTMKGWFSSHQTQINQSTSLIVSEAEQIATQTVYAGATSALDVALKGNNVSGFATSLRGMEGTAITTSVAQIPSFVTNLRNIWLGSQPHYTALAQGVGTLIQNKITAAQNTAGRALTPTESTVIIEAVIKGLQAPPPAIVAP